MYNILHKITISWKISHDASLLSTVLYFGTWVHHSILLQFLAGAKNFGAPLPRHRPLSLGPLTPRVSQNTSKLSNILAASDPGSLSCKDILRIFWRILDNVFSRGFCLENWPPAILKIFQTFSKCYHAVYHSTRNLMLVSKMHKLICL